jgi:hypothetical protein
VGGGLLLISMSLRFKGIIQIGTKESTLISKYSRYRIAQVAISRLSCRGSGRRYSSEGPSLLNAREKGEISSLHVLSSGGYIRCTD